MRQKHIILLILLFGFFLIPPFAFAHTSPMNTPSCHHSSATQISSSDCCSGFHSQDQQMPEGCASQCGQGTCHCQTVGISGMIIKNPEGSRLVKSGITYSSYRETHLSEGFHFVWQPPE